MPVSQEEKEYAAFVVDLMQSVGPVNVKSMFGGFGIFLHGVMFALLYESVLYFKVDHEIEDEFKQRGLEPFRYTQRGKEMKMSYYQAPEETIEDEDEMNHWAVKAYDAALRAASKKKN
ncbi:MAG: TfoX family protein [Desulfobulbaceae bacterium]|nr:MAG: TfoX family protein [Desulfobulbaceae bacterium]